MQKTSNEYKTAVIATPRFVTPYADMDFSDPDARFGKLITGSPLLAFCSEMQLYNHKFLSDKHVVTLEPNIWLLDDSCDLPVYGQKETTETALAINALSDKDCLFDSSAYLELPISNVQVLQALTIVFADGIAEGWPVDFAVQVKVGSSIVWQQEITNNNDRKVKIDGFTVYDPTAVKIIFEKWSLPYRRPRILELFLGIFEEWTGADIYDIDVIQQTDFTNLTLVYDTARIVLRNETRRFYPRAKNSIFASIEARQPIKIFYGVCRPGDHPERIPVGVFYLRKQGWETAATDTEFEMRFVSIIGLLADCVPVLPDKLPTTVQGWIEVMLSTIGENFTERHIIAPELAEQTLTALAEDVQSLNCGALLRYICMAIGAYYGADPITGHLTIQPVSDNTGAYISLSNQFTYPTEGEGENLADIIFKLADNELYTVGGNSTISKQSHKVDNPFVRTKEAAKLAATNILRFCGGSKFVITGRGNPAAELGDIDTFETIFGERVTARRYKQQLKFVDGVMLQNPSWLLQTGWAVDYDNRVEITQSCTWQAPADVSKIRLVLIGPGSDGEPGKGGSWNANGQPGAGGAGGLVWLGEVNVTPGGAYNITVSDNSKFGSAYSSADGQRYDGGWGDIYTGKVYAAAGETGEENCRHTTNGANGALGSGNGGRGGGGGRQGARAWTGSHWVYKRSPVDGGQGGTGGSGCVIIYYNQQTKGGKTHD